MSKEIKFSKIETLHQSWSSLKKYTYEYPSHQGILQTQVREAYDRGNGMTVLLYNQTKGSVILTRQFRLPTYLNGNSDGLMIETCAGKLEAEEPAQGMLREIEEETGFRVPKVTKVFELYMSPGSVTEKIHFFLAPYEDQMKVSKGGGLESEQENIEILELPFAKALHMIESGEIKDAKTIILLQHARLKGIL